VLRLTSVNGTNSASYPSAWYSFSVGAARFYVLDATWPNGNLGTGTLFSDDYAAHWTTSSPEYQCRPATWPRIRAG
jgi:hypothetical protein